MIKGLSEIRRLPRLGVIRLGIKKKSAKGTEYPAAVDYFVIPDEVKKVYGEKPKELDIILPLENLEDIFPQFYKMYGHSTGLKCKGDGEVANQINDKGEFEEVECLGQKCPNYINKKCKEVATLNFLLPKIKLDGIYQLHTSSYHSIVKINSSLDYIKSMFGKISMIPLKLIVEGTEAHPDKKMKKVVYTLRIAFDAKEIMKSIQKRQGLLEQANPLKQIETNVKEIKVKDLKPGTVVKEDIPEKTEVELPSSDEAPAEMPAEEQEETDEVRMCDVCESALTDKEIKSCDTQNFEKDKEVMYKDLCFKCQKELKFIK